MRTVVAVVVAFAIGMSLGVSGAMAQAKTDKPAADKPPSMEKAGKMVEGKIKSVDKSGITLEDGTKLTIPKSVAVPKGQLKPGAVINAEYEEKGASKVATSVQIKG